MMGDPETAMRFSDRLFDEGVFAQPVVFPTVALDQARIRTIVTAAHARRAARPGARGVRDRSAASSASSRDERAAGGRTDGA